MKRDSENFSMEEAIRLANSEAGRQLFRLLRAQDAPAVEEGMTQAAAGDPTAAKQALSGLLDSPAIRSMLEQLRGRSDG